MEDKKNNGMPNISLSEEVAKGTYSNLAIISHSSSEFVLDFVLMLPGMPNPTVQSRIVLTPEHAKRLLGALQDNVVKYESQFGKIQLEQKTNIPPMSFGTGEA